MAETLSFDIIARDLASKAFKDAGGAAEGFRGKLAAVSGLATGAVGVGLTKLGEHLEETRATLKAAVTDAGESFGQFSEQLDKAVSHEEHFGHGATDTNEALAVLTRATGSTKTALADMNLVTELAAAKHESLAEAAQTVAKMHAGAFRPLKEFGINVKDGQKAVAELTLAEKGSSAADAVSAKAKEHLSDVQAQLFGNSQAGAAAATALASTQASATAAASGLSKAQEHLNDVHTLLAGKTKLTASEQISLRHAEEAVAAAQQKVTAVHEAGNKTLAAATAQGKLTVAQQQTLRHAQEQAYVAAMNAAKAHDRLSVAQKDGGKAMDFAAAKTLILKKIHGTAEAQADTFGGKIKALKTHFTDMAAELGTKVGPALTVAGPAMAGIGGVISSGVLPVIGRAIVSFAEFGITTVLSFARQLAAAAAWAAGMVADAAIAMAPFLPWIALLAAVGIAAYELYEHWDVVWGAIKAATAAAVDAVSSVIGSIIGVFAGVIDWVKTHWPLILAIITGPFGLAVLEISKHWDTIVGFITGMPGRIASAASGMWDGIKDAFKATINWIIDGWNSLEFTLPKVDTHIPGVGKIGGWTLGTPDIPELRAMGGAVRSGVPYIVGEQGPELFMPGQSGGIVPNRTLAGLGGALIGHFEQHIHTKDEPGRIGVSVNQGLRDAAFLLGV